MLRKRQVNSRDDCQVVREMDRRVQGKEMDKQQGQRERTSQTWEGLGVIKGGTMENGKVALKALNLGTSEKLKGNSGGL